MSIVGPGVLFRYRAGGIVPSMTFTRSGTNATYLSNAGVLATAGANVLRTSWFDTDGDGILETPASWLEPTETNRALWCRDMTNAAWTKANVTPLLNLTGIDGAASSASRLTSTAGNGTCLQSLVSASTSRSFTAFVKRISGSGTINMTMDNGSTWTAITLTNAWRRFSIPVQTLANPTFGWRIVTSGDVIGVDYAQMESTASYATSPILTTTAAVTRNTDSLTAAFNYRPVAMTLYVKYIATGVVPGSDLMALSVGPAVAPRFYVGIGGGGDAAVNHQTTAGTVSATGGALPASGSVVELRGVLNSTGSVYVGQSINGAAETVTSASTTLTLAGAWSSNRIALASDNTGNYLPMGLMNALVLSGVRGMDSCRALV